MTARVRIPLGVLDINRTPGPVVKLEFTPACQAGGRGFESRRDRSGLPLGSLVAYMVRNPFHIALGRVAQLAERPPEKRKVTGSTPVSTTTSAFGRLMSFSTSAFLIKKGPISVTFPTDLYSRSREMLMAVVDYVPGSNPRSVAVRSGR